MKSHTIAYKFSSWFPVCFVCALIFYISSYQTATVSSVAQDEFILKKIAHLMWSSSLAFFAYRAFLREGFSRKNAAVSSILFVFFYGSTDEIHQRFVFGRESRFRDVLIDTVGGSVAILGLWKLLPILPMKLKTLVAKWDIL
jgi:VanZ family protein